jgi:acylglycerol lipase
MRISLARLLKAAATAAMLVAMAACTPTVVGLGPETQAPTLETERLVARDGATLPLRSWRPDGEPRAAIVALHGFGDHAEAFALPAPNWARDGIVTYAYDQRGFGRGPHRGRWAGTDAYVADLADALTLVRARHPGLPVFVLGESMGGAVAMVAAARGAIDPADGLILVAPAVRGSAALGPIATGTMRVLANTVPWLSGPSGSAGIRPTDNVALLRSFSRDPLVLRTPRVDMVWGLIGLMDEAVAAAPGIAQPSLVLVGGRDIIVPDGAIAGMLARMPATGPNARRVAVYDDGWHMLLRDLQGARVQADVAHWVISRRSAPDQPLPSGADRRALVAQSTQAPIAPR